MSRPKTILLIACLVFLAFANSLLGSYIGDDFLLFVGNDFYRDSANISKLFTREFITTQEQLENASPGRLNSYSGCVAYRPVTALTYFIDYAIWKLNPRGMRLTNLFLHVLNSILVYIVMSMLIRRKIASFLAAILFGVHPIQAEVVNNIGYRSDLLVTLFYLLTFLAFIYQANNKAFWKWGWGFITMALAFFSKETAVTLPVMLALYHIIFEANTNIPLALKKFWRLYIVWGVMLGIYLFLYFFIFPNATFERSGVNHPFNQIFLFFDMISYYMSAMFAPFTVKVLPTFYAPSFSVAAVGSLLTAAIIMTVAFYGYQASWRQRGGFAFLILWFCITYLPTSNIFPIVNPMGFRYLYLPSIGIFMSIGMIVRWGVGFFDTQKHYHYYRIFVNTVLILTCMLATTRLNLSYNNNFAMHEAMRKAFPQSAYPYMILGTIHKQNQNYEKAIAYYHKYMENKPRDFYYDVIPGDHIAWHQIGTCYVNEPNRAIDAFHKAVKLNPDFADAYASIGKAFLIQKNFPQALVYINEALKRDPGLFSAYVYLVDTYWQMGERKKARALLKDALKVYPQARELHQLKAEILP